MNNLSAIFSKRVLCNVMLATLCLAFTQCVSSTVQTAAPSSPIRKVHVIDNPKIHMSGFQPELVRQIQQMGFATEVVKTPPAGNAHYARYSANWKWDMAMYLYKFEITLYEGVRSIGNAKYSATGLDLRKFGPAEEKIRPVLKELFAR